MDNTSADSCARAHRLPIARQVNVYVGPGNGGVSRVFLDSLVALVVWRVTDSSLRASHREQDVQLMLQLQDHLASLGKRVPVIGLRPTEYNSNYARDEWSPGQRTTLNSGAPCTHAMHAHSASHLAPGFVRYWCTALARE